MGSGGRAVLLSGSWARGEAHRYSDLDLWVLGRSAPPTFEWRDPFFVSVGRISAAGERRRFLEPPHTGELLGAWRSAVPLEDPYGEAAQLQREAREFRWERVASRCDRWVARSMVAWGEEAIKILGGWARRELDTVAVDRNLLAQSLVYILAVHRRAIWLTDNGLWERFARSEGRAWASAQRRALGLGDESLAASTGAALELYGLAAEKVRSVLRARELATVERVLELLHSSADSRRFRDTLQPRRALAGRRS